MECERLLECSIYLFDVQDFDAARILKNKEPELLELQLKAKAECQTASVDVAELEEARAHAQSWVHHPCCTVDYPHTICCTSEPKGA